MAIIGSHWVVSTPFAMHEARKLSAGVRDFFELRAHALKLAYWPGGAGATKGQVLDLDWEWVQALRGKDVGELRVDDIINGHNNLRIYFYVGTPLDGNPMPVIWTLMVMDKRTMHISNHTISTLDARRKGVIARYYP